MSTSLPTEAQRFVDTLVALIPAPAEVWLIGSRANGRATANSDTDLLVFGSAGFLQALKAQVTPLTGVDCFVVDAEGAGQDPWQEKQLTLRGLEWTRVSPGAATYVGTSWHRGLVSRIESAVLIWPAEAAG